MANSEHLKILEKGVEAWNRWRSENPQIEPDLSGAVIPRKDFNDANLSNANLLSAKLTGAKLKRASLVRANINNAVLNQTDLSGARLTNSSLSYANLIGANLTGANLTGADLTGAKLGDAQLVDADLRDAILRGAHLSGANLFGANLAGAKLSLATLRGTNLRATDLGGVNFHGASLSSANLGEALLAGSIFADSDLSEVLGLESVSHQGPSTIGIDSLYRSQGKIPDEFLRNAGVPEEIIDVARSIRAGPPIQWYSCFISYANRDEEFAHRLHTRMRQANMRVWFAPEDLKGGKKLHEQLFEAIQIQDRLLLVLSEHSIRSQWVMTEIRKAREVEKKEERRKLFPIRLVDFDMLRAWTCFDADTGKDLAEDVCEYFIPDFSNWKNHDTFEAAFAKLQKDLESKAKPAA